MMETNDIFYNEGDELGLRRGGLAVEWTNIGEGFSGDYDPDDPEDKNLLRFDVYALDAKDENAHLEIGATGKKEEVEDASYCTNVPAGTDEETLKKLLVRIMDEITNDFPEADIHNPPRIKKMCERLSWIEPSWATATTDA